MSNRDGLSGWISCLRGLSAANRQIQNMVLAFDFQTKNKNCFSLKILSLLGRGGGVHQPLKLLDQLIPPNPL